MQYRYTISKFLNDDCEHLYGYGKDKVFVDKARSGTRSLKWWPEVESNHRHEDFQSSALPTELSGLKRGRY